MSEEPTPPRKVYQLKPKEFERVNTIMPGTPPPSATNTTPDPGPQETTAARIDVRELARQANAGAPLLHGNTPEQRANDVHGMLREKYEDDKAAGLYHVEASPDKERRSRAWTFWIILVLVDGPLGWFAWRINPGQGMGYGSAIPFVSAIAGIGMFTAWWTWHNWFLRTER